MAVINKTGLNGEEDFLGFSFNNRHSSEFRIVRTSKSNRYNEEIVAAGKETTIDIPGSDGALFISKKKQKKTWTVDFAFDDVYLKDIEAMRNWLSCKVEAPFRFDEDRKEEPFYVKANNGDNDYQEPLKLGEFKLSNGDVYRGQYHMVVVTGTPKLNYLGFEGDDGEIIYKGDGSVQFTAYDITRWGGSFTRNYSADAEVSFNNEGDLPMPLRISIDVAAATKGNDVSYVMIKLRQGENNFGNSKMIILNVDKIIEKNVSNIVLDSELHLVLGHNSNEENEQNPTSEVEDVVLNDVIVAGDFFEVEPGTGYGIEITGTGDASPALSLSSISYQYCYN